MISTPRLHRANITALPWMVVGSPVTVERGNESRALNAK
jgi:hypothetical protein